MLFSFGDEKIPKQITEGKRPSLIHRAGEYRGGRGSQVGLIWTLCPLTIGHVPSNKTCLPGDLLLRSSGLGRCVLAHTAIRKHHRVGGIYFPFISGGWGGDQRTSMTVWSGGLLLPMSSHGRERETSSLGTLNRALIPSQGPHLHDLTET